MNTQVSAPSHRQAQRHRWRSASARSGAPPAFLPRLSTRVRVAAQLHVLSTDQSVQADHHYVKLSRALPELIHADGGT